MGDANLFCDLVNCGEVAHVFGIDAKIKEKYCQHHVILLICKKMTIYDISGYNFIASFEDVPIYEQRRNIMKRGLGNLTALESQLDSEHFEAQRLLEQNEQKAVTMVVRSYQEIRLTVQRKYETSKQQLQAIRHDFEQYLVSKQNELQGNAHLLCGDAINPLKFLRLAAEDCMLEIAEAIGRSWRVSNEDVDAAISLFDDSNRMAFLGRLTAEATDELKRGNAQISLQFNLYAHALGWNGDFGEAKRASLEKQIEVVKGLQETFQLATDQSDAEKAFVKSTVTECLQAGLTAKSELDIPQSWHWLQSAWEILEKSGNIDKEITTVGLALWEVLGLYFGKYPEAESMLRRCYDIEARFDPLSEEAMKVSNSIAGVFYHSGNWNCAVEVCLWVLRTFSSTSHAAEHFWTTLQYLTHSYWLQGKKTDAQTVVEEWKSKKMTGENEHSEALKLTVIAQHAQEQSNDDEAEKLLIKAVGVIDRYFPTSMLAALDYNLLGILYQNLNRLSESEEHYRKAKAIYEAVSPQSVSAANTLKNLGILYQNLNRLSESEEHYMKAKAIYEAVSPQSISAANTLKNLGSLYDDLKRFSESEEYYMKAKAIYEAVSPQSVNAANNLNDMGILYKTLKRFSESEEHYMKAIAIYEAVSPQSVSAANTLKNLGILYKTLKRFSESEEHYMKAKAIYEAVSPQSVSAATTLNCMGSLYYELKRFSESEEHYMKAKEIYEAVSPRSVSAANTLKNLGILYKTLNRFIESEEHYSQARAIYEAVSPQSVNAANNLFNMGILYEAMGKIEDALFAFHVARTIYIDIHLAADAKDAENIISRLQQKKK